MGTPDFLSILLFLHNSIKKRGFMYKRRARILFWHPDDPEKAQKAALLAMELGSAWLEARANDHDLSWPDLFIALDCNSIPEKPWARHTQRKCWPKDAKEPEAALRNRILGVIGGFRLLARLDQSPPPMV